MSVTPFERVKPVPRWSVARPIGLEPMSRAALPAPRAMVCVGPPLLASGGSFSAAPNARLLVLVPDNVKPLGLPSALFVAVTGPLVRTSVPFVAVLPETIELTIVIELVPPAGWNGPPPPKIALVALARLLATV